MKSKILFAGVLFLAACGTDPCQGVSGTCVRFDNSTTDAKVQTAIAAAQPNTTFAFAAGTFNFKSTVEIESVNGITVKGAGIDKTILNFAGQASGADGVSFDKCDSISVHDLAIKDTNADALKANGGTGLHVQNVSVSWSNPDNTKHGPYGIYPVQETNVIIEDSKVSGGNDSGIYMGQSNHIVVRNNEVFQNVAGIEIENSQYADVYNNKTHDNAAGILVFDLPNLQYYGGWVRVYNNTVSNNDTQNFAPAGDIVANVPTGMGMFVMANHDVEVFGNTVTTSNTASFAVVSYKILDNDDYLQDANYYPYSTKVYVHDNTLSGGGAKPDIANPLGAELAQAKATVLNGTLPDILYDGFTDPDAPDANAPANNLPGNPMTICIGTATTSFANVHADLGAGFSQASTDPTPYQCTLPPLPAVTFPGL